MTHVNQSKDLYAMEQAMQSEMSPVTMEQEREFEERVQRIRLAAGAKNDSELARALGIKPQSIGPARKRCQIPPRWIRIISEKFHASSDWLFFGHGAPNAENTAPATPHSNTAHMRRELTQEREERRVMSLELVKTTAALRFAMEENTRLWQENAEGRNKLHTLEYELMRLTATSEERPKENTTISVPVGAGLFAKG